MLSREKQTQRKKEFKNTNLSAEDSRRKREESSNNIRKSKRDEGLLKRRNIAFEKAGEEPSPIIDEKSSIAGETTSTSTLLPCHIQALHSEDISQQYQACIHVRKMLSIEKNPPIDLVLRSGIVPRIISFLNRFDHSKLQFEAAWVLTNIASGSSEQTTALLQLGAVEVFIGLLRNPSTDEALRDQAVWALGNIAGDSPQARDFVLQQGILAPLLGVFQTSTTQSLLRNATWTISNLTRGKPQPSFNLVSPVLPYLARLIHATDNEMVVDACWALSYLSDGTDDAIEAVSTAGILPRMIELLTHTEPTIQTPALRTIGNIVTGNDLQTQRVIDAGALVPIAKLLQCSRKGLRKEAAWTVSNITAGNREQTQRVIDAGLIPLLISQMNSGDFDVKKECAWAVSNATTWKHPTQIKYLVSSGCLRPLSDLLASKDSKMVNVSLEALDNILSVGEQFSTKTGTNAYIIPVEEAEGIDRLEALQSHENTQIYERAVKILETYFNAEEEETENCAPNQLRPFTFGAPANMPQGGFVF